LEKVGVVVAELLALDALQAMSFPVQVLGDARPEPAVVVATLRDVLIAPVARNALRHLVRDVQRGQLRLACPCHLPSSSPLQSARRKAVPGPRGVNPWPIGPFVQDRRHIPYPDGTPAHPIVERLRSPSRTPAPG